MLLVDVVLNNMALSKFPSKIFMRFYIWIATFSQSATSCTNSASHHVRCINILFIYAFHEFSAESVIAFNKPGVVNRTFENRTQSNSIELNPWIEFDWVRQSNEIEHHTFSEFDFRTNRIQSNKSNSIELNPSDWVRLSSETELNRTQLNGFRSIGSGESIQREP